MQLLFFFMLFAFSQFCCAMEQGELKDNRIEAFEMAELLWGSHYGKEAHLGFVKQELKDLKRFDRTSYDLLLEVIQSKMSYTKLMTTKKSIRKKAEKMEVLKTFNNKLMCVITDTTEKELRKAVRCKQLSMVCCSITFCLMIALEAALAGGFGIYCYGRV